MWGEELELRLLLSFLLGLSASDPNDVSGGQAVVWSRDSRLADGSVWIILCFHDDASDQ